MFNFPCAENKVQHLSLQPVYLFMKWTVSHEWTLCPVHQGCASDHIPCPFEVTWKSFLWRGMPDLGYELHFRAMAKWTCRFGEISGPRITSLNCRSSLQQQNLQLTLECSWSSSHLPLEHLGCYSPQQKGTPCCRNWCVFSCYSAITLKRRGLGSLFCHRAQIRLSSLGWKSAEEVFAEALGVIVLFCFVFLTLDLLYSPGGPKLSMNTRLASDS